MSRSPRRRSSTADKRKEKKSTISRVEQVHVLLGELETSYEELRAQNEELSRTREELERSRDRYVVLYDDAPFSYMTLDREGVIRELNLTAVQLIGASRRGPLVGVPFANLVVPRQRQWFLDHLRRIRGGESKVISELTLLARPSGEIPVELCSQQASGASARFSMTIRDLSERQREEDLRLRAEANLRREEVRRRAAQEAEKAKDYFLATLSHELRTPLTPVLTVMAELEERPDLSDDVQRLIAVMRRNIDSEVRLIDDLLDVTRIIHQKLTLDMGPVDVRGVLRELVDSMTPEVGSKGLALEFTDHADRHTIRADALRLRQILTNLVRNSVQFTDPGGHLRIDTRSNGKDLVIRIQDDGIGMEPEMIARLFLPFEQASKNRRGRLGLGLMIVKGLVEAQDGSIKAESEGHGRGSTFVVRFPLTEDVAHTPVPQSAQPASGDGVRVLLVEDHEDTAESLARLLKYKGYVVTIAKTLNQALEKSEEPFDILLSDLSLPDGSGHELMRKLSSTRHELLPAIALSGRGSENDVRASLDAGFRSHLVKPVHFHSLIEEIERVRTISNGN